MTGRLTAALALVAGVLAGGVLATADRGPVAPSTAVPAPSGIDAIAAAPDVVLAWTSPALPAGLESRAAADPRLGESTVVAGGVADLTAVRDASGREVERAPRGMTFPLDAIAVDPAGYSVLAVDAAAVAVLGEGEALLSTAGARLRRVGAGASLVFAGATVTVRAVVSDAALGGAEVAVTRATGARLGITVPRYLLAARTTTRHDLEEVVRRLLPPRTAVRFRAPGETPFLRDGDAVPPLAVVKERFGEFAYRAAGGRDIVQDPAWTRAHIVDAEVPLLGTVRCHRAVVEPLRRALTELRDHNLGALVDPSAFAGCWTPRRIREDDAKLSRHAWGIALDLNWTKNPTGLASVQDGRLVAAMATHGFTWGGQWLVPDPAHFEYTAA